MAARVMADMKLAGRSIGLEEWTSGMSFGLGSSLKAQVNARWSDISGLVDAHRLVKSDEEQAIMRRTAKVTDAAAAAAIAAIHDGAREADVAAECLAAMTRAGGQTPGFGPFIRPGARLGEEHATWGDGVYRNGEPVFLELSGCISRYHAPMGRLVRVGGISDEDARDVRSHTTCLLGSRSSAETRAARLATYMPHGKMWSTMRASPITAAIIAVTASASAFRRHGRAVTRSWACARTRIWISAPA